MLEDISAIEMAVVIEMVIDRGMNGDEFLQRLDVPEVGHRALSSSKRLMGVFSSIVEPSAGFLAGLVANLAQGCAIRWKSICYHGLRSTEALHRFLEKPKSSLAISRLGDEGFQDFTLVIDGPPEIVGFAIDPHKDFVNVPPPG